MLQISQAIDIDGKHCVARHYRKHKYILIQIENV